MRQYTRIVFGLNAVGHMVLGLFSLLAPAMVIGLFGGDPASEMLVVTFRILGVQLIPVAVMSALICGRPDDTPMFRGLLGLVAVLSLVCWGTVIGMHHLQAAWIVPMATDVLMQTAILVAVIFYYSPRKSGAAQIITRKRIAA